MSEIAKMRRMAEGVFEVLCPCCAAALKVDAATGVVLAHKKPEKPAPVEDLAAAVSKLKGEAARREEIFEKSFSEHNQRQSILDKRFDELFRQAKEDPDQRPPQRDIDLD